MSNKILSNASHPLSFRLSLTARQLLKALTDKYGISKTAVIEMAIRKYAQQKLTPLTDRPQGEATSGEETTNQI
jgi:hypothetical protein